MSFRRERPQYYKKLQYMHIPLSSKCHHGAHAREERKKIRIVLVIGTSVEHWKKAGVGVLSSGNRIMFIGSDGEQTFVTRRNINYSQK